MRSKCKKNRSNWCHDANTWRLTQARVMMSDLWVHLAVSLSEASLRFTKVIIPKISHFRHRRVILF